MQYWGALLCFLALSVSADNTLYEELKTNSDGSIQPLDRYDFSLEQTPPFMDDRLPETVDDYQVSESLKEQFQPINDDAGKDYLPQTITVNDELPSHYKAVIGDSLYLQLMMLSSIGALGLLPEELTNWNAAKLKEKSLSQRWKDHVTTKPVWDDDSWVINYIGHPVSGAWYYTMARNDGLSIGESATFSALMSTFFWEYGYEAFAEVPSIQDLIFTPLFGSLFGEGMFVLQGRLDENNGMILGSRSLGNISYFFLDPLGNIARGMRNILKSFHVNADVTMTIQSYPYAMPQLRLAPPFEDSIRYKERELGFIITFE